MVELKTKKNDADVQAFLHAITPDQKRNESLEIFQMMQEVA